MKDIGGCFCCLQAFGCRKGCKSRNSLIYTLVCGERGIRTPVASQLNGFQDRRNRPLCHLSIQVKEIPYPRIACKGNTFL